MSQKTKTEIEAFIMKHACNPVFWLDALETSIHCTDGQSKQRVLQNSHDKLKLLIDYLMYGKEP